MQITNTCTGNHIQTFKCLRNITIFQQQGIEVTSRDCCYDVTTNGYHKCGFKVKAHNGCTNVIVILEITACKYKAVVWQHTLNLELNNSILRSMYLSPLCYIKFSILNIAQCIKLASSSHLLPPPILPPLP